MFLKVPIRKIGCLELLFVYFKYYGKPNLKLSQYQKFHFLFKFGRSVIKYNYFYLFFPVFFVKLLNFGKRRNTYAKEVVMEEESRIQILKHEKITIIVHSLRIDGEVYEKRRENKSVTVYDSKQSPTCSTTITIINKIGDKTRVAFKEGRINGKLTTICEESPASEEDRNFRKKWNKNWKPKIKLHNIWTTRLL